MEIRKSQAIVLSSRAVGEADRSIRAFTREFGKKNFIFKGLRKSKKRAMAAAEPGTFLELVYYYHEGRDFHIVNEFTIKKQYTDLHQDLEKMIFLFFMLELVDKTTAAANPVPRLFDMLAAALEAHRNTEKSVHLAVFFALHLLKTEGVIADNYACKLCGRTDMRMCAINPEDFMFACESCAGKHAMVPLLPQSVLTFIKTSAQRKFSQMNLNSIANETMLDFLFVLCLFVEKYFNVVLKSKSMVLSKEWHKKV
jgi:DNA repair protein RecO (recombination protein O)